MSFAAIAGALIGAAADSAKNSSWMSYSASKSLNKKTAKQNAAIGLSSARQLAENQPSWEMQGLRDAGLNPILAAQNFGSSSMPSVNGSVGSGGSGSFDNPVHTALSLDNLDKQNSNLDRQNELLAAEKKQVEANTLKAVSEAELNSAKTKNTFQDTLNKEDSRGQSGLLGAYNQAVSDVGRLVVDPVRSSAKSFTKSASDYFRKLGSRFSNSAKDFSDGTSKIPPRMLHETKHSLAPSRRKHN